MGNLIKNFFAAIGRFLSAIFNIKISLKFVIILCVLLGGGMYFFTNKSMLDKVGGKEDYEEAMRYIEIKDLVDANYIDPVDRKVMGDAAANAMISSLGDSWTYHMTEAEYTAFQLATAGDYEEMGISMTRDDAYGGFLVMSVSQNSPAAAAGLSSGMLITSVDGVSVKEYSIDDMRTLVRSKLNKKFYLEISDGQFTLEVDCTKYSSSSVTYRMEKTGAGYLQLRDFEAGSGEAATSAIEAMMNQGATALVIDLRNNSGGLTDELAIFLDYLLPGGRIFSEIDKNGDEIVTESDGMCVKLPMCVLINTQTYREAELCAAVLREFDWAILMGEVTSGNTRTQETIGLSDGSAIRMSTKSYLTAKGTDIAKNGGVVPDSIVYNSDASTVGTTEGTAGGEQGTSSTSNDEQLMAALRYLS